MTLGMMHSIASGVAIAVMLLVVVMSFVRDKTPGQYLFMLLTLLGDTALAVILNPWTGLTCLCGFLIYFVYFILDADNIDARLAAAEAHDMPSWARNTPDPHGAVEHMQMTLMAGRPGVRGRFLREDPRPGFHREARVIERTGEIPQIKQA